MANFTPVPAAFKSIIFLGSKPVGYQCLRHLLQVQESLGLRVTGVLTQARKEFDGDQDVAGLAAAHHVPLIPSPDELPDCDILYSVQYHRILQQQHIDRAGQIAVNLHMAPLPEYRGCNQFSFAILDGRESFGTSIHRIDTRIDHGDLLFEKRFPVPPDCWVTDLYELTHDASVALFSETLPDIAAGRYTMIPQSALVAERGSSIHYRKDIQAIKEIDLSWPKDRIERHIRATSMPGFEPPYAILGGRKIYFSPLY
jgi:methionyl-tRNA formyltransferase